MSETRELFTIVPWADANGCVLFCQVIFKNCQMTVGNIPDNLATAPILLQHTENAMQTGATFKEAVIYLRARFNQMHAGDIDILGPEDNPKIIVFTTDGHASRYDLEVLDTCRQLNIRPNIRKGGSSWLTQMWDQIFQLFSKEYLKIGMTIVKRFEAERENAHNYFKMNKRTVLAIIVTMFKTDGGCSWASAGDIVDAWHKVGFTWRGIDVGVLLSNPIVTGSATADARFRRKKALPSPDVQSPQKRIEIPDRVRTGSFQYYKLQTEKLLEEKRLREQYDMTYFHHELTKLSARELVDSQEVWDAGRIGRDEFPSAVVNISREEGTGRIGAQETENGLSNINHVTGDILDVVLQNGLRYVDAKRKRNEEKAQEIRTNKRRKEERLDLLVKYLACKNNESCSCGSNPCIATTHHYCKDCHLGGRTAVQKKLCERESCPSGKANRASVLATRQTLSVVASAPLPLQIAPSTAVPSTL